MAVFRGKNTLQEINISHLAKRKISFKYALSVGYVNSLEGTFFVPTEVLSWNYWNFSILSKNTTETILKPKILSKYHSNLKSDNLSLLYFSLAFFLDFNHSPTKPREASIQNGGAKIKHRGMSSMVLMFLWCPNHYYNLGVSPAH